MIKLSELHTQKREVEESLEVVKKLQSLDYSKLLNKSNKMPLWNRSNLKDFLSESGISMTIDTLMSHVNAQKFYLWKEAPCNNSSGTYRRRLDLVVYAKDLYKSDEGVFFRTDAEGRVLVDKDMMAESFIGLENRLAKVQALIDGYEGYKARSEQIVKDFNEAMAKLPREFQESIR